MRVIGEVKEGGGRYGAVEVEIEEIEVLARAETPLPLDGNADPDARLDHRHLDLRPRDRFIVFEVQTTLEAAMRDFVARRAASSRCTRPKITAGGSESGATVFEVAVLRRDRPCLVQSPQFYMQMGMAAGFDRVFEIGPVFRNEPGVTNRHATEFTIAHFEMSWIESHQDLITLHEDLLRYALSVVEDVHGRDVERYCGIEVEVPREPIPRISLADAVRAHRRGHRGRRRTRAAPRRAGAVQVRPAAVRPQLRLLDQLPRLRPPVLHDARRGRVRSSPPSPGASICSGGGSRSPPVPSASTGTIACGHRSPSPASRRMQVSRYLDPYYLDMFRYGCPPHGGFGFGVNRLVMSLLAQPSMRETSFVFRGPGRFVP